jgi:prostaglandin-endoperoxide synthase 2
VRTLQDIRYSVANRVETYVTTNLSGLWKLVQRTPAVHRRVNRILIDRAILKIPTRPNPLSTMAAYTSGLL